MEFPLEIPPFTENNTESNSIPIIQLASLEDVLFIACTVLAALCMLCDF